MGLNRKHAIWMLSLVMLAVIGISIYVRLRKDEKLVNVKIGVLMPLNIDLQSVATRMKNGMELAREDLLERNKGQLGIEILYENGCYEQEAASAVQKFIHSGVSIIGGSFCLFGHIPILPLTEANKIITFNTAANPDVVLHKNYAFSTNVAVKDEAERIANFAFKKIGGRRAVVMHLDTPFGHDYYKYFSREFENLGGDALFNVPAAPDAKNFEAGISKIKETQPDVIITAHFGVPLGTFFKQVREAGINEPIVGNYETEDTDVLDAAGAAAEGIMFSSSELENKTKAMENFDRRYIRKFGQPPDVVVTNSYDDIVLGVECYLRCAGDRDCMRDELHKVKDYQGASGLITINPSGATSKPTTFKIIKDRTFIRYQW